jgi:hypothetical protein
MSYETSLRSSSLPVTTVIGVAIVLLSSASEGARMKSCSPKALMNAELHVFALFQRLSYNMKFEIMRNF